MGEILYHYCPADCFDKIMSNRTVRLTDVRKSNDYKEVVGAGNVILKLFCDIYQNYLTNKWISEERFLPAKKYVELTYEKHCTYCYWLAFCLTSLEDNLGQWREYGRNAGYAIGFDAGYLQRKAQEHKCYHFSPIIYKEENDIKDFYSIAEDLMRTLIRMEERAGLNNRNGELRPDVKEEIKQWLYRVMDKMPFYKSKAFEAEKETRFCYVRTVFPQQLAGKCPESSLNNIDCMINGTEAKMYLTIPFDPEAVKAIWIGPRVNISEHDMHMYLTIKGFDSGRINIQRSKITMQ